MEWLISRKDDVSELAALQTNGRHVMCRDNNKEKMWVIGWEMRGEEKPDNAIDTAERAGMKKHWKAKDVSTVRTRMEMTAGGRGVAGS